ncbi:MAG: glycosyltransferase family 9 protein [Acidobacteria bacterium]|nr:glycosyltransferase family 9 protein [Acidobacteriota bacterium]
MRVLIVRLGAFGDVVHAIPVAAALGRRFPDAVVDWVIDERYAPLLDLVPGLGRRVVLRARGRALAGWAALRRELREVPYDVALDVQGLGKSALAARLSGASRVVGFSTPFLRERWARWLYTETADPGRPRHVVDRNLGILGALGVADREWDFPIRVDAPPAAGASRRRFDPPNGCVVINPNAAWPTKRWPPERYGAVAAHVGRAHGRPCVVIWGPGDEARAAAVAAASDGAATPAPPTGLVELAALLRAGALLVSGDTGPLHLAAALGTPVVGLYGSSDPARNGPWSPDDEVVSAFPDCACAAGRAGSGREVHMVRRCRATRACLDGIAVEQVCAAVDRRLQRIERGGEAGSRDA